MNNLQILYFVRYLRSVHFFFLMLFLTFSYFIILSLFVTEDLPENHLT